MTTAKKNLRDEDEISHDDLPDEEDELHPEEELSEEGDKLAHDDADDLDLEDDPDFDFGSGEEEEDEGMEF